MTSDAESSEEITIKINRTMSFKSVVNPLKFYGSVTLSPYPMDTISTAEFDFMGKAIDYKDNLYSIVLVRYNHKDNAMTFADLWFDKGLKNIVITESNHSNYLYMSADNAFIDRLKTHKQ